MRRPPRGAALFAVLCLLSAACTEAPSAEDAEPEAVRTRAQLKQADSRPPCENLDAMVRRVRRGHYTFRSPDITFIAREPNYVGTAAMPVHSGAWDYLAHVPLVAYGPGHINPGSYSQRASMADLAPTTAKLIGFNRWPARDGRVLSEMVDSDTPPRLVVSIVWDGGGWNALEAHPDRWPYLKRLMSRGASYERFDIGSSPSVTPPIHTNLGTGSFPARHGMTSLKIRVRDSVEQKDPFGPLDARNMKVTTLADEYDRARGNQPVAGMLGSVSWHLGMIGHGSALRGADQDPVVLLEKTTGLVRTNPDVYSLPDIADPGRLMAFAADLDVEDGVRDRRWRRHSLETPSAIHYTPATSAYDEWLLERLVKAEGFGADRVPDLLYANFKTSDIAGHKWGMSSPEVGDVFAAQDASLRRFVRFLDGHVGRGRWVLFLTADHGQMPYPKESGAWPIYGGEIARDMNAVFDKTNDDISLVSSVGAAGIYVRRDQLERNDATLWKMARWVAGYTIGENLKEGQKMPARFTGREDELLMDAVLVGKRLAAVACREE